MKNKVLVTRNLLQENEERVKKLFDVKLNKEEKIYKIDEVIELSKDCDGILSFLTDKLDSSAINKLSNKVKIIANYAVGFGNIDINAATIQNSGPRKIFLINAGDGLVGVLPLFIPLILGTFSFFFCAT